MSALRFSISHNLRRRLRTARMKGACMSGTCPHRDAERWWPNALRTGAPLRLGGRAPTCVRGIPPINRGLDLGQHDAAQHTAPAIIPPQPARSSIVSFPASHAG
jgi:hypothetical protein